MSRRYSIPIVKTKNFPAMYDSLSRLITMGCRVMFSTKVQDYVYETQSMGENTSLIFGLYRVIGLNECMVELVDSSTVRSHRSGTDQVVLHAYPEMLTIVGE